jgi:hypothetical protein
MKRFLKLTMALTVAAILSTSAFAQTTPPKTHDHKAEHDHSAEREQKFATASKRLNLTADQETKLKEILATNKAEMKTLKEANKDASKDEKRTAMIGQMKKMDGQITAILDAKQIETYKQMKAEKKKELQQKREAKMKEKQEMEEYQSVF